MIVLPSGYGRDQPAAAPMSSTSAAKEMLPSLDHFRFSTPAPPVASAAADDVGTSFHANVHTLPRLPVGDSQLLLMGGTQAVEL